VEAFWEIINELLLELLLDFLGLDLRLLSKLIFTLVTNCFIGLLSSIIEFGTLVFYKDYYC